jgi:hypothetical protein
VNGERRNCRFFFEPKKIRGRWTSTSRILEQKGTGEKRKRNQQCVVERRTLNFELGTPNVQLGAKKFGELGGTKGENPFDVGFHEESLANPAAKDRIAHSIVTESTGAALGETVFMNS